ncbi:hypothetical protein R3P38DRAFT_1479137 [Favolaschia claudopus]|uniref:Uncharacterized protein n=1 Tax=Favolaschia claudopus TaxID=2862362 RepID=A0AAW0DRY8_9AGAR
MSVDFHASEPETVPPSEYGDDSSEGLGGIPSDEDDGEEEDLVRRTGTQTVGRGWRNISKINSLAGIVDTDAPELVPLRASTTIAKTRKNEIRLSDLPSHLQTNFTRVFTPDLIRYVAALPPWEGIEGWEDLVEIWDPLFPEYPLAGDTELQKIVVKLADGKISGWRNKFSSTAVESLEEIYAQWKAHTPQDRAEVVDCLLEGNDKQRAFYYREYSDKEGNLVLKGIFQSYMIIRGLATHYAAVRSPLMPDDDPKTATFPEPTPLVYAIQACHGQARRARTASRRFLKSKLGRQDRISRGKVCRDSDRSLIKLVRKLEGKQKTQEKIMEAALEESLVTNKKRAGKAATAVAAELPSEAEPDFELVDNDSD